MLPIDTNPCTRPEAYTTPRIQDYGSLVGLTADFDLHLVGSVAKLASLAAVSSPLPGGGGGGEGPGGFAPSGLVPDGSEVLSGTEEGGGPAPLELDESGGVRGDGGAGSDITPTQGDAAGDSTGSGVGGAGGGAAGGSTGGGLPFTGLAVTLVAGVGAALTGAGAAMRAKLRRRS